jgi:hypothetical protein
MRHGFEAVTIKIASEQKRELQRRCLEHPQHGRWNGPKSYADLIREAIAEFLAPKPSPHVAKQIAGKTPQHLPAVVDDLPFYVHRYRAGDLDSGAGESVCGLVGLEDAHTTNLAENVTCPRCTSIRDANARALATSKASSSKRAKQAELPHTRAPKKTAKKARARR